MRQANQTPMKNLLLEIADKIGLSRPQIAEIIENMIFHIFQQFGDFTLGKIKKLTNLARDGHKSGKSLKYPL